MVSGDINSRDNMWNYGKSMQEGDAGIGTTL